MFDFDLPRQEARKAGTSNTTSSTGNSPVGKGQNTFLEGLIYIIPRLIPLTITLLVVSQGNINIHNLEVLPGILLNGKQKQIIVWVEGKSNKRIIYNNLEHGLATALNLSLGHFFLE